MPDGVGSFKLLDDQGRWWQDVCCADESLIDPGYSPANQTYSASGSAGSYVILNFNISSTNIVFYQGLQGENVTFTITGVQAGDLMIGMSYAQGTESHWNGWTRYYGSPELNAFGFLSGGGGGTGGTGYATMWTRRADGTENGSFVVTTDHNTFSRASHQIVVWRGGTIVGTPAADTGIGDASMPIPQLAFRDLAHSFVVVFMGGGIVSPGLGLTQPNLYTGLMSTEGAGGKQLMRTAIYVVQPQGIIRPLKILTEDGWCIAACMALMDATEPSGYVASFEARSGGSVGVNYPTGTAQGDRVFAIHTNGGSSAPSYPAGWDLLASLVVTPDGFGAVVTVLTRLAPASPSGAFVGDVSMPSGSGFQKANLLTYTNMSSIGTVVTKISAASASFTTNVVPSPHALHIVVSSIEVPNINIGDLSNDFDSGTSFTYLQPAVARGSGATHVCTVPTPVTPRWGQISIVY